MKIFIPVVDNFSSEQNADARRATMDVFSVLKDQAKEQVKLFKEKIPSSKIGKDLRRQYSRDSRKAGITHQPYAHFITTAGAITLKQDQLSPVEEWADKLQEEIQFDLTLAQQISGFGRGETVEPVLFYHSPSVAEYLQDVNADVLPNVSKVYLPQAITVAPQTYPENSELHNCEKHPILAVWMPSFAEQRDNDEALGHIFPVLEKLRKKDEQLLLIRHENTTTDTAFVMTNMLFRANLGSYPSIEGVSQKDVLPALMAHPKSKMVMANDSIEVMHDAAAVLPAAKLIVVASANDKILEDAVHFYHEAGYITQADKKGKIKKPVAPFLEAPEAALTAYHLIDAFAPVF